MISWPENVNTTRPRPRAQPAPPPRYGDSSLKGYLRVPELRGNDAREIGVVSSWQQTCHASLALPIGVDDDVHEAARPRLDGVERVVDAFQPVGLRLQVREVEHTRGRHLGHQLALSGREPVRAAKRGPTGHESDRLYRQRLRESADVDR